MLPPARYLEVVETLVGAIGNITPRDLTQDVPHCPGFDVGKLLEHTGGFCRIVAGRVARDEEWMPPSGTWQQAPAAEVGDDPIGWHKRYGNELLVALRDADPTAPITTWAGHRTRYFWFRRAAQELTIHRFDLDHALGRAHPDNTYLDVAVDGINEFLGEFGERAARLLDSDGSTWQFSVAETGLTFTVTAATDTFISSSHQRPDVVADAPAETLHRFVWGRATPADLDAAGDVSLLTRWHDFVRI